MEFIKIINIGFYSITAIVLSLSMAFLMFFFVFDNNLLEIFQTLDYYILFTLFMISFALQTYFIKIMRKLK